MKKLYFIRHGQTVMNASGHFSGRTDTPLTEEGRSQAKKAGKLAKDIGIDLIVSSPLSRAHETARIIAREIGYPEKDIMVNNLFIERDFGELEGKPWSLDVNLDGISDIETVDMILERARLAHEFLHTQKADTILVVSHGSFGRALRSVILPEHVYHNNFTRGSTKYGGIPNAELVCWLEN